MFTIALCLKLRLGFLMVEVENKRQFLSCVEFQVPGMEVYNSNCHVLVQILLC